MPDDTRAGGIVAGRHWGAVLILVPVRWYSWDFRVLADGRELAVIDRHWFHERATFTLDGTSYDVRRTGTVRGSWVLEQNDTVLAQATKPSAFRRRFEITFRHERYELASASPLRREFQLLRGGVPVGRIRPASALRRGATAELPHGIPPEVQLFITFLVLLMWKRSADAAAGA